MEISAEHIFGPVFALVAMFFYGKTMVQRSHGRQVRVMPALILIIGALLFQILTTDGTLLDVICRVLLSFGVAMIIDSRYLAIKKEHPKVFWVPGLLALIISGVLYFFASVSGYTSNGFFDGSGESDIKNGQVVIELGPDDTISELDDVLEKYDAEYRRAFPEVDMDEDEDLAQYYLILLPEGSVEGFLTEVRLDKENVDDADYNYEMKLHPPSYSGSVDIPQRAWSMANDPEMGKQWWLTRDADAVHAMLDGAKPNRKAIVAIVDTGVEGEHEDLNGIFGKSPADKDIHGHGTHCAGLAGAVTNNGKGIASYNWEGRYVEVRGYQALGDNGSGSLQQVIAAVIAAAEGGADVISMSLGSTRPSSKMEREAMEYATRLGSIIVAAAGNDGGQDARGHAPGNINGLICVSATTSEDRRAPFSNINTGLSMPLAAPGADIYSTIPGGGYASKSGTSMATPIVAGVIGIMRAFSPNMTAKDAWKILHDTGTNIPDSHEVGRLINPAKAIKAVM